MAKRGRVVYNRGDGILEIIVRDETGMKIDHFKVNLNDKKRQARIFKQLKEKYGIDYTTIEEKEGFFDF